MTFANTWPIVLLVVNLIQGLILFSFRTTLRNAVLELKIELGDKYATKGELADVKEQIELAKKVDAGFSNVTALLSRRRTGERG
jgi:hypothetical protein